MPRLKERDETYFSTVRGMCRRCRSIAPARVFFRDDKVWQQSLCTCGEQEPVLISSDSRWYLAEAVRAMPDHAPIFGAKAQQLGCPHDCGPCTWHASPCQLPVISITNACNLRCPICFTYNRADRFYYMPVDEMRRTVDWIIESTGQVDLINITGGEPTLHPYLFDILQVCRREKIGRVTLNSNGIRLAEDMDLCRRLADMEICVILSLNTFDPNVSRLLHGRDLTEIKQKAIDNLAEAGVRMTMLQVLARGINEDALPRLLQLLRTKDNILSLTIQTMAYTGQGGGEFSRSQPIPVDEAANIVCGKSDGAIVFDDFFTRPSAHPLCYLMCYMLKNDDQFLPFTRFASKERIQELLKDSYLPHAGATDDFFTDSVNRLFAEDKPEHLAALRQLMDKLFPPGRKIDDFQRQRIAESNVRTIYLHAHMDEDTFDCSRAMLCPDLVPSEPGRFIPACTYNLFYRMKDERFFVENHQP